MQRVLFVIRGKLGDTLTTYAAVRAFADTHPQWQTVLLVRKDYARLLEGERRVRLIAFGTRLEMIIRLLWERIARPGYDVLALAWGFGKPARMVARLVRAQRRIHFRGGHSDLYPQGARVTGERDLFDAGWETARLVAGDFPKPTRLEVPALARRYQTAIRREVVIGVAPIADELRKNFDASSVLALLGALRLRHPGAKLRILANPRDRGTETLRALELPAGAELRTFRDLREVCNEYLGLKAWYGTDTGLYHLAAAMGLPATVFFGPTQPWKIVAPAQEHAVSIRLEALGREHCEVKSCTLPICLHHAVGLWCGLAAPLRLEDAPAQCPLRTATAHSLEHLA